MGQQGGGGLRALAFWAQFILWNYWAVLGFVLMAIAGVVCAWVGPVSLAIFAALVLAYYASISSSKAHTTSKGYDGTKGVENTYLEDFTAYFHGMPLLADDDVVFDPKQQYVISSGPHGIHGHGTVQLAWAGSAFYRRWPAMRGQLIGVVASVIFSIPIARELFLASGFRDASRAVCERLLREGKSIFIITGGAAEALLSQPGTDRLVLKKRLGFIRLALKQGCSLVPTYTFGNTDVFDTSMAGYGWRKWLASTFRVCLPLYWGRWGSLLPYSRKLSVAVGKPIPCPKLEPDESGRLDDAVVQEYHGKFCAAVQELFEKHKGTHGYPPERKLEIV